MPKKQILDWINEAQRAGYDLLNIKNLLIKKGYLLEDIEEALDFAENYYEEEKIKRDKGASRRRIKIILYWILILLLGFAGFLLLKKFGII